jgi:hypothetical protein
MYNGVLDNPYSLPNIIRLVTELRNIRRTGHLVYSGGKEKRTQSFRWKKLKGRNSFEDHGEDVNILVILKCVLKNKDNNVDWFHRAF